MNVLEHYRALVARGELNADISQELAARKLDALVAALKAQRPGFWQIFTKPSPPRGLYLWGDVGRGKSMLMDLFFEAVPVRRKLRVHFNAFMTDIHARIHEWRNLDERARSHRPDFIRGAGDDPIAPVARSVAQRAEILCFDEFQVGDVADAMILGRLFEQLFADGVVIVATSNTPPRALYEGGLNRQLFLPFIVLMESRMDVVSLSGAMDYRLNHHAGRAYLTPLGPEADAQMDDIWQRLSDEPRGEPFDLTVLGRKLHIPQAANGVARFSFNDLCAKPLAAADYLAIARTFHALLIDRIPVLKPDQRNEARRFTLLIDTLYDQQIKLFCSAQVSPEQLYPEGDGAEAFRRTASRLAEMQSDDYLARGRAHHDGVPLDID